MNMKLNIATSCLLFALGSTDICRARTPNPVKKVTERLQLTTAIFDGDQQAVQIAERQTIERMGTTWMRLRIGEFHLGEGSYITTSSLFDGGTQRHTAESLAEWDRWTAIFNGDAVEVILFVGPNDAGAYVTIESVVYAEVDDIFHEPELPSPAASLCNGNDNRVASSDSRVGRLFWGGCTGWLISNGGVLTAGHCTDSSGDIGGVLEFNVPLSSSNGRTFAADPSDQYPVSQNYMAFQDNGTGNDWAQFLVGANADTGLRAHIAQGFFRLTDGLPAVDTILRVTGYGVDNVPAGSGGSNAVCCDASNDDVCEWNCNATAYTQQTSTGRLDDIGDGLIEHEVDTMPANSGSPIIWESNGLAIGIHTAGGCDDFWNDYDNHGTAFGHPTLAAFVNDLRGGNAVYVDTARNLTIPFGTVFRPWDTVAQGAAAVPNGGVVSIVEGNYPASSGNTFIAGNDGKSMTLEAPVGLVTIGN